MTPREFAIAEQFVQANFRELYQMAEIVLLTPCQMFPPGQTGQCSRDNFINISDGIKTVGEFVNTIVHELTHAKQNRAGVRLTDQEREEEAYAAGIRAADLYMIKAAPWGQKGSAQ